MSFSSTVKNELCRVDYSRKCCLRQELAAGISMSGVVSESGSGVNLRLTTENAAFARRVYSQLKVFSGIVPEVIIRKSKKLKKHVSYILVITSGQGARKLLDDIGVSIETADAHASERSPFIKPDMESVTKVCCRKSFLRGAFLAGGSVSDPEKTYHLEITAHSREIARFLTSIIGTFKLHARIIKRKGSYVTYLKEGENIVDFLNIIGAHTALMELENVRILKGMRNSVNRIVNCETANLEKTVNASVRQVENIKYIIENLGLDRLPENLREIAELRLEYSEMNLAELGQLLNPPLGKSGVNHRLRKLDRIAESRKKVDSGR